MLKITSHRIFLLVFLLSACTAQASPYKTPLQDEGEVILYLQPMPQEAERLRFRIEGVTAVKDDGSEVPLFLSFDEVSGGDIGGMQRQLATGALAPGLYKGIAIQIQKAAFRGEEGETALLVPEKPVVIKHAFRVMKRKAFALFLGFDPSQSIPDGFRFTPVFSLATQGKALTNLTGYVTNSGSNVISVFNKKTMRIVGMIATEKTPRGIVLDQERGRGYVACSGSDVIEVIDVFAGEILSKIRLRFGDAPRELALSPDGETLVSANYGSNSVSIINPLSLFEVKRIEAGEGPSSVAVDPRGLRAYILNSLSDTISVLDLSRKELSATLSVEGTPLRGDFSRSGDALYVISKDSPNLTVIDPIALRVTGKIFVGIGAASIKVDTQTGLVLIGKKVGGEITVIDPFSLMIIDTIDVRGSAAFMTIDDEENALLVVLPDRKMLRKVNLVSKKVIAELEVQDGGSAVAAMGER